MGRLEELYQRGSYECPRNDCDGEMERQAQWSHDVRRTAHAVFRCSECRYEEELVVAHYADEQEVALHAQHPTLTGRARCPRCGEPMSPRALVASDSAGLRFVCQRCGGARDVVRLPEDEQPAPRKLAGTILVVDRDVPRGMTLRQGLVRKGRGAETVEVAGDEHAALALLSSSRFDVLVIADDGSLNTDLVVTRAMGEPQFPRELFLLTPHESGPDPEPLPARRLPLPCPPALLTWFIAYSDLSATPAGD